MRILLSLMLILASACTSTMAAQTKKDLLTGVPRIVDGDTAEIARVRVRLVGIDAPETDQVCLDAKGQNWNCGIEARDQLVRHSSGREWQCTLAGIDRYGRSLGKCMIGGEDVQAWMVQNGWALSFTRYSRVYDHEQEEARSIKRGLWAGAFIAPWDWRRSCPKEWCS